MNKTAMNRAYWTAITTLLVWFNANPQAAEWLESLDVSPAVASIITLAVAALSWLAQDKDGNGTPDILEGGRDA